MGRRPCCEKVGIKQGRWTDEEDEILTKYIQENGEGSWRSLPKNAGLLRCGKSCRLRWINYLRPELKRGDISEEEEDLIIKLRATMGNKWSAIARKLKRTDNEIKNYWNSHLSRKIHTSIKHSNCEGQPITVSIAKIGLPPKRRAKNAMKTNQNNKQTTVKIANSNGGPGNKAIPFPHPTSSIPIKNQTSSDTGAVPSQTDSNLKQKNDNEENTMWGDEREGDMICEGEIFDVDGLLNLVEESESCKREGANEEWSGNNYWSPVNSSVDEGDQMCNWDNWERLIVESQEEEISTEEDKLLSWLWDDDDYVWENEKQNAMVAWLLS